MAKQTITINEIDHPIIGTEYQSTYVLANNAVPSFDFYRGTESGNNRKYVETDNPYPNGGILYAIQLRIYGPTFVPVDYSAPNHTYATLNELARFMHFAELSLKYGDDDQFEDRKLENLMAIPELAKPFLSGGVIASGTPATAQLVFRERPQIYEGPNDSMAVDGLITVGQGGKGIVVDSSTRLSLSLDRQSGSDYLISTNLNGFLLTATFIGPRFASSGVTRG